MLTKEEKKFTEQILCNSAANPFTGDRLDFSKDWKHQDLHGIEYSILVNPELWKNTLNMNYKEILKVINVFKTQNLMKIYVDDSISSVPMTWISIDQSQFERLKRLFAAANN